jgi:cytochrome c
MDTRQNTSDSSRKGGRDPLLLNKIAGGILTGSVLTGTEAPKKAEIKIASNTPQPQGEQVAPVVGLIRDADVKKGQAFVQQQCSACHSVNQGGANGVGPNLYGVMGAPMFAKAGYSFSGAAKKKAHGNWTYHKMNLWLHDPQDYVPGTRMSYPGIKNVHQRADVIAYLRTLAKTPIPLPKKGASETASAGGGKSAGASGPLASAGAPVIKTLYAKASVAKGKSFFGQQCAACHSANKGGANGVGPNLYGVLDDKMFAKSGYSFSSAAKKAAQGKWTPHEMNEWLYDPQKAVPGTRMGYPGIRNNQTRADVIAYLNSLSDHPAKLP